MRQQVSENPKLTSLHMPEYASVNGNHQFHWCGDRTITDGSDLNALQYCTGINSLTVRAPSPALARARLIAPAQPLASRQACPAAELARGHACVRCLRTQS